MVLCEKVGRAIVVFMAITARQCAGAHRNIGAGFSKVRALTLDSCWTSRLLALLKAVTGAASNEFWEGNLGDAEKLT